MIALNIYDLSGRKVVTLVNALQPAALHEVEWIAEDIQPGIYICELKTGGSRMVIKMILIQK